MHFATTSADGSRGKLTLMGLGLLALSVLALFTDISVLGIAGIVAFGAGTLLLALSIGRRTIGVTQVLLAFAVLLVASAPWLPWLDQQIFSWLRDTAVPMIDEHEWSWPVLLFVLLLPPVTGLTDLARRRHPTRRRRTP